VKQKLFISLILILTLISGCTSFNNGDEIGSEVEQEVMEVAVSNDDILERSELLSDVIVELFGIDDATTLIFNNSALVGIKVAYDQELTDDTKEIIENKIMNTDPNIEEVLISNKARMFNDIEHIVLELLQGKSYDSLVDNISKIKNRFN
jgi:YhcN/YlaJ family sporulation lipoprotein